MERAIAALDGARGDVGREDEDGALDRDPRESRVVLRGERKERAAAATGEGDGGEVEMTEMRPGRESSEELVRGCGYDCA